MFSEVVLKSARVFICNIFRDFNVESGTLYIHYISVTKKTFCSYLSEMAVLSHHLVMVCICKQCCIVITGTENRNLLFCFQ